MTILIKEAAALLKISEYEFQKEYCGNATLVRMRGGLGVQLSALPESVQGLCRQPQPSIMPIDVDTAPKNRALKSVETGNHVTRNDGGLLTITSVAAPAAELDVAFREAYDLAPVYNKKEYDFYYPIVRDCVGLSGQELKEFVENYNQNNPGKAVTVATIYRKCEKLRSGGKIALLGKYGKNRGKTSVPDEAYGIYEALILKNIGVTEAKAWRVAAGLIEHDGKGSIKTLPKTGAFSRRLKNAKSRAVVDYARKGKSAYNRKHAPYIERDYEGLHVGQYWVSDHVQLDTVCTIDGKEETVRSWLTSWVDVKSGKVLGHHHHATDSNADDIFTAFFNAASVYGIPRDMLIDNGKDFRAKNFSGGKKGHKHISMCGDLDITVHFSEPYRPQSKPIERLQRELNEGFSVFCKGYCGGNILKKPEDHEKLVKSGKIEAFEAVDAALNDYIYNVLNKRIIVSGYRKGKTPDQIWSEGYEEAAKLGIVRAVPEEQLKLLCYRTSRTLTIQRNTITDSEVGIVYTNDELFRYDRRKVYVSRNHGDMLEDAYVYDAETHEFLTKVEAKPKVNVLADNDKDYHALRKEVARHRAINKMVKTLATPEMDIPLERVIAGLKAYTKSVINDSGTELPNIHNTNVPLMITSKAEVLAKIEEQKKEGAQDLSILGLDKVEVSKKASTLYNFEWERDEALGGLAAG